ncbi:uncharacterized protein Fot_16084 [Forsythia ovata]|uniref:Uncharacterized protein n=1 Tax=Forsythia ovata TaxID=205694 RepID=A0ABD1WB08_9LAMI
MAGTQQKRQREESHEEEEEFNDSKRQNSYDSILSILDDEQEYDTNQDLSAIFTTLQQELSCSSSTTSTADTFDFDYLPSTEEEPEFNHHQAAGGGSGSETSSSDGLTMAKSTHQVASSIVDRDGYQLSGKLP